MISAKWQRRTPKVSDVESTPGVISRIGSRLRATATGLMFESVTPVSQGLPDEVHDNGPFGRLGPNTAHAIKRGGSAVGRTVSSPFGALLTVTIADEYVRVLTARGNRVRTWAEGELPSGVVQHGLIVDEQTFIDALNEVMKQVTKNGKLNGQKIAIAITGRNMVQRRLTVYVEAGDELADAVINASSDSMSIRTEEMHIEWDSDELDLIDEDELEELEDDDDDLEESESSEEPLIEDEVPEELGLETLTLDMEGEPDGDPHDVYALALHKHVIRRNIRTVSEFSNRFAGVQPKILALAAAVNSQAGVVLDIEKNTLITAVVSGGLPEVIREVGLESGMSSFDWEKLISAQISQAVAFYDSIFPEEPLGTDVEVFLTGDSDRAEAAVERALEKLPYVRSEMPRTLRASEDFPFEKYAANVGLVIVSGKRFWQRAPVPLLSTPKFDYRPSQYRPRPLPIGPILKIAAALILAFGVFSSYQLYSEQTKTVVEAQRYVEILELRHDLRAQKLEDTRGARLVLDAAKVRTERLIAANDVLKDQDAGFSDTASVISGIAPQGVEVTSIDDDGRIVAVSATSAEYYEMLAYVRMLEDVPQFEHVQVLNIARQSESTEDGVEPSQQAGGPVLLELLVEASLVITRIEIDDRELLEGEELAAVSGSN